MGLPVDADQLQRLSRRWVFQYYNGIPAPSLKNGMNLKITFLH